MAETASMRVMKFWPGDVVKFPSGPKWTVAAVALVNGERYTFLVRKGEVNMLPTVIVNEQATEVSRPRPSRGPGR